MNYVALDQDASGLAFGSMSHAHPPNISTELNRLLEKGISVYMVQEDAEDRGIEPSDLMPGITPVVRGKLPEIFADYDQVWHW